MLEQFLNEEQNPEAVKKVHARVSEILTKGEEIQYIAIQKKPAVNITPDSVVLTNKRFIIYRPKLLGRVDFEDYIWRDLRDARMKEGLLGATLTMQTVGGKKLSMDYLPKAQARRLYSLAQEMEEEVREERRRREMEEKRAAAGGVYLQGAPVAQQPAPQTAAPAQLTPMEKLQQLKQMLDAGLITQEQYETKSQEILAQM